MKQLLIMIGVSILLVACTNSKRYNPLDDYREVEASTNLDMPSPNTVSNEDPALIERGEYLVELLGCGSCHTDGALIGKPNLDRLMAGSDVGIAYTNPFTNKRPGVVFPRNLTPDPDTGLGLWSDEQIATAIQAGAGQHGSRRILVMPWQRYAKIADNDMTAIVRYLRNLEPAAHKVPNAVPAGTKSRHLYVHFGVYLSREFD